MGLRKYRFDYSNQEYFNNIYFFFESLKDYIDQIDNLISNEVQLATKKLEVFTMEIKEDPTWCNEIDEHVDNLRQKSLLRIIYYDSLIIVIYSFIEKQLLFACQMLEKNQEIKINDITGKGIFKYRNYLTKVIKIDFTEINEYWNTLIKFNRIRNFLVHSNGFRIFPKSNQDLKNSLSFFSSIELNDLEKNIGFNFIDNKILKDFCVIGEKIIYNIFITKA